VYKHLRRTHHHLGYNDIPYDVDFTDGVYQWQVCYKITENNIKRETACAKNVISTTIIVGKTSSLIPATILQKKYSDFLLTSQSDYA
jgi:hypothetical protein